MKLTYLGTAAAEGWPAPFCHCKNCEEARRLKGRNIRSRPQAMLNQDLLFDFGPDTFYHSLEYGLNLDFIRTVLLTHSHCDHFHPLELILRCGPYAYGQTKEKLHLFGNEKCEGLFRRLAIHDEAPGDLENYVEFHTAEAFQSFTHNGYEILPLKAVHDPLENCLLYAVCTPHKKWIFYGNDTGAICEETWNAIRDIRFDLVSLDCTMGTGTAGYSHLNLEGAGQVREQMLSAGCANGNTQFLVTHFSHGSCPLHEELSSLAKEKGFTAAYDGMTVTL